MEIPVVVPLQSWEVYGAGRGLRYRAQCPAYDTNGAFICLRLIFWAEMFG